MNYYKLVIINARNEQHKIYKLVATVYYIPTYAQISAVNILSSILY